MNWWVVGEYMIHDIDCLGKSTSRYVAKSEVKLHEKRSYGAGKYNNHADEMALSTRARKASSLLLTTAVVSVVD